MHPARGLSIVELQEMGFEVDIAKRIWPVAEHKGSKTLHSLGSDSPCRRRGSMNETQYLQAAQLTEAARTTKLCGRCMPVDVKAENSLRRVGRMRRFVNALSAWSALQDKLSELGMNPDESMSVKHLGLKLNATLLEGAAAKCTADNTHSALEALNTLIFNLEEVNNELMAGIRYKSAASGREVHSAMFVGNGEEGDPVKVVADIISAARKWIMNTRKDEDSCPWIRAKTWQDAIDNALTTILYDRPVADAVLGVRNATDRVPAGMQGERLEPVAGAARNMLAKAKTKWDEQGTSKTLLAVMRAELYAAANEAADEMSQKTEKMWNVSQIPQVSFEGRSENLNETINDMWKDMFTHSLRAELAEYAGELDAQFATGREPVLCLLGRLNRHPDIHTIAVGSDPRQDVRVVQLPRLVAQSLNGGHVLTCAKVSSSRWLDQLELDAVAQIYGSMAQAQSSRSGTGNKVELLDQAQRAWDLVSS